MKFNKATFLFGASLLAIVTLIALQINWLKQSRGLIESQFNQKVSLALGSAIAYLNNHHTTDLKLENSQFSNDLVYVDGEDGRISIFDRKELDRVLGSWLRVYDISLDYDVSIIDERTLMKPEMGYSCPLSPVVKGCNEYKLAVSFPGKESYIHGQMRFQLYSSILILLFISAVFFVINYAYLKQKRISENNIDFFNNTAHEFKTPLTNIILAMSLLKKKNPGVAEERYAKVISKESTKLMGQIKRVLHLSQMESGQYKLKTEPLDLASLIQEVVEDMTVMVEEQNGSIDLDIPKGTHMVEADRYHLGNVFRNLIDNSLKYCSQEPLIKIKLLNEADGIKLKFEDNGIGISRIDQKHIFQKFQRVNTGDIHDRKGFGIGLSYVKAVLELHKGFIHIVSELNKGSRFDLFLPKA
jgi:two-component system phosphate regulon sensor histidine kinase PhoR